MWSLNRRVLECDGAAVADYTGRAVWADVEPEEGEESEESDGEQAFGTGTDPEGARLALVASDDGAHAAVYDVHAPGQVARVGQVADFYGVGRQPGPAFSLKRVTCHPDWPGKDTGQDPLFVAFVPGRRVVFSYAVFGIGVFDADTGAQLAALDTYDFLSGHRLLCGGRYLLVRHSEIYFGCPSMSLWRVADLLRDLDDYRWVEFARGVGSLRVQEDAADAASSSVEFAIGDSPASFRCVADLSALYADPKGHSAVLADMAVSARFHALRCLRRQCVLHLVLRAAHAAVEGGAVTFSSAEAERVLRAVLLEDGDAAAPALIQVEARCIGMNSGAQLDRLAARLLTESVRDEPLNFAVPRLVSNGWVDRLPGLDQVAIACTLRFAPLCASGRWRPFEPPCVTIDVRQRLTIMPADTPARHDGTQQYMVDPKEPCHVEIRAA